MSLSMRRRIGTLALCGAVLAGIVAGTATPAAAAGPSALQQALDAIVATGIPGAAAMVRDGDKTTTATAGVARLDTHLPMRVDDRVRVGSITKTFVATVVLQLVGEHRIGLDDPVAKYLPGLLPNGANITVRELLQHRSGLFNYTADQNYLAAVQADPTHVYQPRDLVDFALSHPADFAPGTKFEYSNTNYVVLGMLVEAVTGHPFGHEITRRIIAPLGLRATSVPDAATNRPAPTAHGYLINGAGGAPTVDVANWSPSIASAAGAIVSDARDLTTFYRACCPGACSGRHSSRPWKPCCQRAFPARRTEWACTRTRCPAVRPSVTPGISPAT